MASQQPQQSDGPHAPGGAPGHGGGTDAGTRDLSAAGAGAPDPGPREPTAEGDTGDGAPEPAAEGGIRAAERSAERAAALAATEGFHQLRLRPYVGPSHENPGTTTVRPLLDPSGDGPATADLGLFPEIFAEFAVDGDGPYQDGGHGPGYAEGPGGYDGYDSDAALAAAAARGRHRRRKRGLVVAAAAVAASALAAGAVAVTGQLMGGEQGAAGQALPDLATSVPDVTLPADAAPATAGTARPVTHTPPVTTAPATKPATAKPSPSPAHTTTTAPPSPTPTASATTTAPAPPTASHQAVTSPQVLRLGDSGPAVADLQQRLTEVWVYHGPIDGVFDRKVQKAVAMFQVWYEVSDAPDGAYDGVYGPKTRAALERQRR